MDVAICSGCRTPFTRSGTSLKDLSAIDLGKVAVREALFRGDVPPEEVEEVVLGTVVHNPRAPNLAREVGLATLPPGVPGTTVSRACTSSNQAIADASNLISQGYARFVLAGGAESLSHVPITVSDPLAASLMEAAQAKTPKGRLAAFRGLRPRDLLPARPQIAEYSTGETMGEAAERMAKINGIPREEQDDWALRSHERALEGTRDGRLAAEVVPVYVPDGKRGVVDKDNGIREDTSLSALASLAPVFDRNHGSVTAGNSSPLTDGAAAVVLASREAVDGHGIEPLAWIRSYAFAGVDPADQLLQGPAYAVPVALDRAGISMKEVGLMEMHEAFSAQVLSNLQALSSKRFAEKELGRSTPVGHPDPERINVMGGSIAIGHPFGATGARLTLTLAREMPRRDVEFGLITVCAAGGMGFAMVLQRG